MLSYEPAKVETLVGIFSRPNEKPSKMKTIVDQEIWVIDNFLSEFKCDEIIKITENVGFSKALINMGGGKQVLDTSIRDCGRVMIDDVESAKYLAENLKPYVPMCQEGN